MKTAIEQPLIEVTDLSVRYKRGQAPVLRDVSFSMNCGESIALVGDSGCGKSTLAMSLMRLLPADAAVRGSIVFRGDGEFEPMDLMGVDERTMQAVRGKHIAMVFQNSVGSLDPVMRVGNQIAEVVRVTQGADRSTAHKMAIKLIERVGLPSPQRLAQAWPHELSGGMAQRVGLALALAGNPSLIIADEPTSAMDANVQSQILEVFRHACRQAGVALLLITHDICVAQALANRVCVLDRGSLVDNRPIDKLDSPSCHAATKRLVDAARLKSKAFTAIAGKMV